MLSVKESRQLQIALLLRPEQGAVIRGTKRGGVGVIYYWEPSEELFYMLYAYPKNVQDDLTAAQVRTLSRLVEEELK